jgi:protease-4
MQSAKSWYTEISTAIANEWNYRKPTDNSAPPPPTQTKTQRAIHWAIENPTTCRRIFSLTSFLTSSLYAYYVNHSVWSNTVIEIEMDRIVFTEQPVPLKNRLNPFNNNIYYRDFVETCELAATDKQVKGVILKLHTNAFQQLMAGQVDELRSALLLLKSSGKFSIGYWDSNDVGSTNAATVMYYFATACTDLACIPLGVIHTPGLMMDAVFVKRLLNKLSIDWEGTKREEYKVFANTFTEERFTEPHRETMETIMNDMNKLIIDNIAKERDVSADKVSQWFNQAIFTAPEAVSSKVIDHTMFRDEVYQLVEKRVGEKPNYLYFDKYIRNRGRINRYGTNVALIFAEGAIESGESDHDDTQDSIHSKTLATTIRNAWNDKSIKAIILRVNSPGGSAIASDEIRHEIQNAKKHGKKVIISMSSVAASGGYWISMDADRIIANPFCITGSIGVVFGKFVIKGLAEKLGITEDDVRLGRATFSSLWHNMDDSDKQVLNSTTDDMYNMFLEAVSQARHMDLEQVKSLAKGKIYLGTRAKEEGLIDAVGGLSEAISVVKSELNLKPGSGVNLVHYPKASILRSIWRRNAQNESERDKAVAVHSQTMLSRLYTRVFQVMNPLLRASKILDHVSVN